MKKDKILLIVIISFLLIFVAMLGYGFVGKYFEEEENPNKETYYEGHLYFFKEDEIESKYKCEAECSIALELASSLVLINDSDNIKLYSTAMGRVAMTYKEMVELEDSNLLLLKKDNGLWGILDKTSATTIVPYEYDEISLLKDLFLVRKASTYYLLDNMNTKIGSEVSSKIIDYSDKYIITEDNKLYDYNGNTFNTIVDHISISNNYFLVVSNNILTVYGSLVGIPLETITVDNYTDITISEDNNGYIINGL